MATYYLHTPLQKEELAMLQIGDQVYLSGIIYTGRDAAHKRMIEQLALGQPLPFSVENQMIYYVGPTPAKPGQVVGSAGPTSSYRMDKYAVTLLEMGLQGMIGKGKRSPALIEQMVKSQAVYFGAIGGAAALISKCITKSEVIAYEDLGPEAIHRYTIENMPLLVLIDCKGNNIYEIERKKYSKEEY